MDVRDEIEISNRVDAAIGYAGLLLRALAYAAIALIADRYDCGKAILTGVLAGDMLSRLATLALEWRDNLVVTASELILLGIVFLFVRSLLHWPDDLAMRAILGLAAFGVFTVQAGASMVSAFGTSRNGFD